MKEDSLSVKLEKNNSIATISINRPDYKNAFNPDVISILSRYLTILSSDSSIKVVILRGEGDCFCAGADLTWMRDSVKLNTRENIADSLKLANMLRQLYNFKKPTIACVQGSAFGGAIGLIACCDIAIASENTKFCLSEVKIGLSPAVISPYVIQAIGQRISSKLMLTAEVFTSEYALETNLIHLVVSNDKLLDEVNTLAKSILLNSPQALTITKQLIQTNHPIDESLEIYTAGKIADLRSSAEGQEGINAFLEKRPPNWQ